MKKWLLRIGLGFISILVLLYGFVMLRSSIPATVNDRDLQLQRASIPAGSNAFDVLQTAKSHLWWPDDQSRQLSDLVDDTNWNASLADKVLTNNREALTGWYAAAKLPNFQAPEISGASDLLPYLADWKKMAQLAEVRGNVLLHCGQDKEAFDRIMEHVQLGQQMQNAHGPLIDYLVGVVICNMGLNQMERWVGRTHLTPDQLKDYIHQLGLNPDARAAAFANTIKAEYRFQVGSLEALRQGQINNGDLGGNCPRPRWWFPVFNISQTKALFAGEDLILVKAAPQHFNEAKLTDFGSHRPGPVSLILSGNLTGEVLYYTTMPAVIPALSKKSQSDVQLQSTRVILALRAYQLTHGNLPSDLNALVPEFLDAVPVDDFDGQPLRYSAEKKIVYSVGKNLKDDGGDDKSNAGPGENHLDLACPFDF